jgi:hypothetical protein
MLIVIPGQVFGLEPHLYFLAKWLFAADIRTYIRLLYMMIGHCYVFVILL